MPNRPALVALIVFAGLLGLPTARSLAQTSSAGPAVEIFTSQSTGGSAPGGSIVGGGTRGGSTGLLPLARPLNISFSLSAGYDDNVNTSAFDAQDSLYASLGVNLSYAFGTERTQATLSTNSSVAYYATGDQGNRFEYRPNLELTLSVRHGVSERLTLNGSAFVKYALEPDFELDVSLNRRSGNYFYTAESLAATYLLLERWTTITTFSFSTIQYEDEAIAIFQDRQEQGFGQQVRFLVLPLTTAIGEYRLGLVDYEAPNRDSTTHSLLIGVDQTIGPRVSGSLRVGAEFRTIEGGDTTAINPYADTTLSCVFGERTSVSFNARYSTEESDFVESPSRQTFRTGLSVTYGLTPRITSSLGAYYRHDSNEGTSSDFFSQPGFTEDSLDIALSFSYAINPRISANAGYNRTQVFSQTDERSYSRNRYFAGVSIAF